MNSIRLLEMFISCGMSVGFPLQIKTGHHYITVKPIRVITKLPNTEQSSKGKGKTHKSTNKQNQSTTGKLG